MRISLKECRGWLVDVQDRSSKSALHGLIHWLSQVYAPKGVTVNGVAPALITGTSMLPGQPEELKSSKFNLSSTIQFPSLHLNVSFSLQVNPSTMSY